MSDADARVVITADDQASAAFSSASKAARDFGAAIGQVAVIAGTAGTSLAAMTAGLALHAGKEADALNDLSQKLGMSVQQLASYKLAAEQSGTSLEQIGRGIKALSGQMLAHGDAFRKMGIDTQDADKALRQLADVFSAMPDGMEKTALATKLFGRAGQDLIPMLNLGSRGLAEAAEKSQKYAEAMAILAPQADKLGDTISELQITAQALGANLAIAVVPKLNDVAGAMAIAAREGGLMEAALVGIGGAMNAMIEPWRFAWKQIEADILSAGAKFDAWRAKILFGSAEQLALKQSMAGNLAAAKLYGEIAEWNSGKPKSPSGSTSSDSMLPGANTSAEILARQKALQKLYAPKEKTTVDKADPAAWNAHDVNRMLREEDAAAKARAAMQETTRKLTEGYGRDNAKAEDQMRIMPESERQLAESLRQVSEKADAARESLSQKAAALKDDAVAQTALKIEIEAVTAAEAAQKDTVRALWEQQQQLNGSWEYGASEALQNYRDELNNVAGITQQAMTHAFKGMEDALVNFVKTGKLDFKSLADSIISDIIRIQVRRSIMQPLVGTGKDGDYGLMGNLGNAIKGWFTASANGNVFSGAGIGAYSGQIVSRPTLFPFASGIGLMGEAGPEAILPLQRGADGKLGVSGSGVNIVVNNTAANTQATATAAKNNNGGFDVEILVRQALAKDMSRNGPITQGFGSLFGLQRAV